MSRNVFEDMPVAAWMDELMEAMSDLTRDPRYAYASNFPPMNVFVDETTGEMQMEFALAGYDPKDIEIVFSGDALKVMSKKAEAEETRKIIKHGIRARTFECKYQLATGKFDTDNVKATFKNGMLYLKIPASKDRTPKSVKIETE